MHAREYVPSHTALHKTDQLQVPGRASFVSTIASSSAEGDAFNNLMLVMMLMMMIMMTVKMMTMKMMMLAIERPSFCFLLRFVCLAASELIDPSRPGFYRSAL